MASPLMPATMQAWTFNRRGRPVDIMKLRELPTPSAANLSPEEVLIKVSHVTLEIGLIIAFSLFPHATSYPWIPELSFSGTVAEMGEAAKSKFKQGDQVMGFRDPAAMWKHTGVLCEYTIASSQCLTLKPKNATMAEASGLIGVGCTTLQSAEIAKLRKGDKVLITGGSGSVGSALVQVCRAITGPTGYIAATCSGRNAELVKGFGADEIIDYTIHSPLHSYLQVNHQNQPFNAIFDIIGDKELHTKCPAYLTSDGWFVLLGEMDIAKDPSWWKFFSWMISAKLEKFKSVIFGGIPRNHDMHNTIPDQPNIERTKQMVEAGQLKPQVDSIWEMEDALKAYERSASQRARGRVVVKVER